MGRLFGVSRGQQNSGHRRAPLLQLGNLDKLRGRTELAGALFDQGDTDLHAARLLQEGVQVRIALGPPIECLTNSLLGPGEPAGSLPGGFQFSRLPIAHRPAEARGRDQHRRRHAASKTNESYEEWLGKLGAALPMGRYGHPEEFAAMELFLCSEGGGYIAGTAINVDGGRSPVV